MNILNKATRQEDETKSNWQYISNLRKTPGGKNNMIEHSLCDYSFNGSYSRVKTHLLKIMGRSYNLSKHDPIKTC